MRYASLEGKYEILETLEDDGQQAAFRVRHRLLGEECLVRLRPHQLEDPRRRQAFEERLPWFTRLKHRHVTTVFDVSVDGHTALMETAWEAGRRLDDLVAEESETPEPLLALQIADQLLSAVDFLHAADWAHGSLSPAKFLIHQEAGAEAQVKLIDPGFAHLVGAPEQTTAGGLLMQRLRHAPPERFVGEEPEPTVAGDLYVVGLILYELMTGHYPIAGDQPTSIAAGHLLRPPLDFAISDPQDRLPGEVRHALLCCLAKTPEARFSSIAQLRATLAGSRAALPPSGASPRFTGLVPASAPATGAELETRGLELRRLLEDARAAAARRDFTNARHLLRRGQELAPDDQALAGVLREVERAARDQQQQEHRRRQLDDAAAEVEHLLAIGDWRPARERLEAASRHFGSSDRLKALQKRVEAIERRETSGAGAGTAADELVERARRLSQAESFDSALDTLGEALQAEPGHAAARTLSESVAALAAMHRRQGVREATIEGTTRVIREHLEKGEPGRAMAQLNRAVARHGNRTELQELRFAIAEAFLRAELGGPAHAGAGPDSAGQGTADSSPEGPSPGAAGWSHEAPPQEAPPQEAPPQAAPPRAAPLPAASRPEAAGRTPHSEPPPPGSQHSAAPEPGSAPPVAPAPEGWGQAAPEAAHAEPVAAESAPAGVESLPLFGRDEDEPAETPAPLASTGAHVPSPPPAWLDLRRARAWVLIVALMILVALVGRWLALRQAGAPLEEPLPALEVEDVRPSTPGG